MPLVPYLVDNHYGFAQKGTSQLLIDPIYSTAEPEVCSRLVVSKSDFSEIGVIDTNNNVVLPLVYNRVQIFEKAQLITSLDEHSCSILSDLDGMELQRKRGQRVKRRV